MARLRARGLSWEAVAAKLDADPDALEQQADAAGTAYRALYRKARREVTDEACAEALVALRQELRSDEDKARRQAADTLLKLLMTQMRHRRRGGPPAAAAPAATPAEADGGPPLSPENVALVRFLDALPDERLAELARDRHLLDLGGPADPADPPDDDPPDDDPPGGGRPVRPVPPAPPGGSAVAGSASAVDRTATDPAAGTHPSGESSGPAASARAAVAGRRRPDRGCHPGPASTTARVQSTQAGRRFLCDSAA